MGNKNKLHNDETTRNEIEEMLENKMTQAEIAEYYGVGKTTVQNFIARYIRNEDRKDSKHYIIPKMRLLSVYNNDELSMKEKAEKLGVSVGKMYDNLAYHNSPLMSNKTDDQYYKRDIPSSDEDIIKVLNDKTRYAEKCRTLDIKLQSLYGLYVKYNLEIPPNLERLINDFNSVNVYVGDKQQSDNYIQADTFNKSITSEPTSEPTVVDILKEINGGEIPDDGINNIESKSEGGTIVWDPYKQFNQYRGFNHDTNKVKSPKNRISKFTYRSPSTSNTEDITTSNPVTSGIDKHTLETMKNNSSNNITININININQPTDTSSIIEQTISSVMSKLIK